MKKHGFNVWLIFVYLIFPIAIVVFGRIGFNNLKQYSHQLIEMNKIEDELLSLQMNLQNHFKYRNVIYFKNCEVSFRKIYEQINTFRNIAVNHPVFIDIDSFEKRIKEYHNSFYEYISVNKDNESNKLDLEGKYSWMTYFFNLYSISINDPVYVSFSQANGFAKSCFISIIENDSTTLTRDYYAMNYNIMSAINYANKQGKVEIIDAVEKYKAINISYFNSLKKLMVYQTNLVENGGSLKKTVRCYFKEMDASINRSISKSMTIFVVLLCLTFIIGVRLFFFIKHCLSQKNINPAKVEIDSVNTIKDKYAIRILKNEIYKLKEDSDKLYDNIQLTNDQYRMIADSVTTLHENLFNKPITLIPTVNCKSINDCISNSIQELKIIQRRLNENAVIIIDMYDNIGANLKQDLSVEVMDCSLEYNSQLIKYKEIMVKKVNDHYNKLDQFKNNNNNADNHLNNVFENLKYINIYFEDLSSTILQNEKNNEEIAGQIKNLSLMKNDLNDQIIHFNESLSRMSNQVINIYMALKFGEA